MLSVNNTKIIILKEFENEQFFKSLRLTHVLLVGKNCTLWPRTVLQLLAVGHEN